MPQAVDGIGMNDADAAWKMEKLTPV